MKPKPSIDASRRRFIKRASSTALGGILSHGQAPAFAEAAEKRNGSKASMKALYESLSAEQREAICFDWDYRVNIEYGRKPLHVADPKGVLLRTHTANAWKITPHLLASDFYTDEQRTLVLDVMDSVMAPGWTEKLQQQGEDDYDYEGGWGADQAIAFFGTPDAEHFQCMITGNHLTLRAGSGHNTAAAFGGGIAHGHQPSGFYEKSGHPGNIWWYQSKLANQVYALLDEKQRSEALIDAQVPFATTNAELMADMDEQMRHPVPEELALVDKRLRTMIDRTTIRTGIERDERREGEIRFRGPNGDFPGLPIAKMGSEQRDAVRNTLEGLLQPYRQEYRDQVMRCLEKQGGIEACSMAFYEQLDMDGDEDWDVWRIEGPSFVWFFRGAPHVHIWFHVADDTKAPISTYFG